MDPKIKKFFLFIILFLLQSCSGGRIGNFIESSFKNIEEIKIKENIKNNQIVVKSEANDGKNKSSEKLEIKENIKNNQIVVKSEVNDGKNKDIEEPKIEGNTKSNLKKKILLVPEEKLKNNKKITQQTILSPKKQYRPQSYKIIIILRDVDPKAPIEDLSIILRNSDVNFEIEKIERFFESKNKNLKK